MKYESTMTWKDGMAFEADVDGFKIILDADEAVGGSNSGPKPKPLVLTALGGCTAMDVIAILGKMQIKPEKFTVKVESDMTEDHPKTFSTFKIIYEFDKGQEDNLDKIEKAIKMSLNKYCGVAAMIKKITEIPYEVQFL